MNCKICGKEVERQPVFCYPFGVHEIDIDAEFEKQMRYREKLQGIQRQVNDSLYQNEVTTRY